MAHGPSPRVIVLLALMLGAALPPAAAQEAPQAQPAICFPGAEAQVGGACQGDVPPNYLQGSEVTIDVPTLVGANVFVSVRCQAGCPALDPTSSNVYWATFRGTPVVFPRDFHEPGPDNNGDNAVADQAPRYNSTWVVTAHFPGAPASRPFHVWLYDAFIGTNMTVRPGELHLVRASGISPGTSVTVSYERRDAASGRYHVYETAGGTADPRGLFEHSFRLPPSEATNILACGGSLKDCYRITVTANGKPSETVPMQVGLARIERGDTTPRPSPANVPTLQRTQNATFDIDLHYPGGRLREGPKLYPDDLNENFAFGDRSLRVAVERVFPNQSVVNVDEVALRYEPSAFLWRATWTIPKDIPIQADGVRYRLRLAEQADRYGNIVPEDVLGNFTVEAAEIRPLIIDYPGELERTELGTVRLAVRYYNGSPFTAQDAPVGNQSPIAGCFLRVPPPPPQPAPPQPRLNRCAIDDPLVWGTYHDGAWNFTARYPRDHAGLGLYRFVINNGTQDRYGNTILNLNEPDFNRNFELIPAKPTVAFATVRRGADSEVLERGDRVYVSAEIRYHDGSPYDHTVRVDPNSTQARTLSGLLVRRGPSTSGEGYGPIATEEVFNLTEIDPSNGRWGGYLQLTDDDAFTPAGIWTFRFDIADNLTVPNANATAFDREVVANTIVLCPTSQPSASVPTGTTVKFRFQLYYSECGTRVVPDGTLVGRLNARVHRFDPASQSTFGDPVSNVLVPTFTREPGADWGLEYEVADRLFTGSYVIVVTGADAFGNKVLPGARSRPFSTYTDIVERSVLTQPPAEVQRGESATVVFDAREGDTALDPRFIAWIELQRFDPSATGCPEAKAQGGCWVRERRDVRLNDPTFEDHLGVFPVDVDTPVGVYRFSLEGRDARFRVLSAFSDNFTVNPTVVARALLSTPPERIAKGEAFTFYVEKHAGDEITSRAVFLDGRPIQMPNAILRSENDRINVTWAVPFQAPAGNYTLGFRGRDVSGNDLVILTPPVEVLSATLEGRILGQPTRSVQRGDEARIQFAVSYPDGSFYAAPDAPVVYVRNATGVVATADIRREGLSFGAVWRVPANADAGDHYFEVSPQVTGPTGNAFPPLRSSTFKVIAGSVVRPTIDQVGPTFQRLTGAIYSAAFQPDDKYVEFHLVYYGAPRDGIGDPDERIPEITRSPIPHTIDPAGGKYVARVITDHQSQTGLFRVEMSGEDAEGNRIFAASRAFVIEPTIISVQFDTPPGREAFGDEKTITLSFVARYQIGTIMDDTYGRPSVALLYNGGGGERPVTQRPELEYLDGRWYLTWTAPDDLPDGTYTFAAGGEDMYGNRIANTRSTPYLIRTELGESFAKTLPGPSPVLIAILLAGLALGMARIRSAKR